MNMEEIGYYLSMGLTACVPLILIWAYINLTKYL